MGAWSSKTGILAALALFAASSQSRAVSSTYQVVAFLGSPTDYPGTGGVFGADTSDNLYVTAGDAELYPYGAVFKLLASSGYAKSIKLFQFSGSSGSTNDPDGGLTLTDRNVILGTTIEGDTYGYGSVFDLGTARHTSLTNLHAFYGGKMQPTDGAQPYGLTAGPFNHYYGTATYGGADSTNISTGDGVLYSIVVSTSNPRYQVLHRFGKPGDGISPTHARLAADAQGHLYGMTIHGGAHGIGAVFMVQYVDGGWQEQVIYSFTSNKDFQQPTGNVALDAQGNVYGCAQGGTHNKGGIFRLTPPAQPGGVWEEAILYNFGDAGKYDPTASAAVRGTFSDLVGCGITLDPTTGLIVGNSRAGGEDNTGTIFTLTPPASGQTAWTEVVGHSFGHKYSVGEYPTYAPLRVGVTYYGGSVGGEIYAFKP